MLTGMILGGGIALNDIMFMMEIETWLETILYEYEIIKNDF